MVYVENLSFDKICLSILNCSLSLDSTKSPIQKDSKSVGNGSQKSNFPRKTPSDIAHFPNTQKQTPSALSMKRKLEVIFSDNNRFYK